MSDTQENDSGGYLIIIFLVIIGYLLYSTATLDIRVRDLEQRVSNTEKK